MNNQLRLWIRRFTLISMVLPLFLIGGFVGAMLFMDFNQYKPQLNKLISDKTGYPAEIQGQVKIGLYPFSLTLDKLVLHNKPAFGAGNLLEVEATQIQLSLWALFIDKALRMQGVEVEGAKLHLKTLENGQRNWAGLSPLLSSLKASMTKVPAMQVSSADTEVRLQKATYVSSPASASEAVALPKEDEVSRFWMFDSLVVHNATVISEVQRASPQASSFVTVSNIDLMAFDVAPDRPFKTSLAFSYAKSTSPQQWLVDGMVLLNINPNLTVWQFNDWNATLRLKLPASLKIPELQMNSLGEALRLDFNEQKLVIQNAQLVAAEADVGLSMQGKWGAEPLYTGHVNAQHINVPKWIRHAGFDSLNFVNPSALTSVSTIFDFTVDGLGAALNNLQCQVDQAQMNGHIWQQTLTQQFGFELVVDNLDMDAYQVFAKSEKNTEAEKSKALNPEVAEVPKATTTMLEASSETYLPLALPIDTLRHLNAEGHVIFNKLKIWQLNFQQAQMNLLAKGGQLALAPLDASLYDGALQSKLKLDVTGSTPHYAWQGKVKDIQLGPFLTDGWQFSQLSGRYEGYFDFDTEGVNDFLLKQNLNGQFLAKVEQGSLQGMDLTSLLSGQKVSDKDQMPFSLFEMNGKIKQGVYRPQKLILQSPSFDSNGFGQVDLTKADLKMRLNTILKQPPAHLVNLKGIVVPIEVAGPLSKPKWSVNLKDLLSEPGNQDKLIDELTRLLKG